MNKKGSIFDVIVWLVVAFVVFLFFAGFLYGFNLLSSEVEAAGLIIPDDRANITEASQNTFGQINTGMSALRWLSFVIVVAMIISIMVSNFLVKAHPAFLIVYILITVVAVVLSVYISNAYENILTADNPLTETLQSFTAMNFIMLNLPIWTTIVGFAGAIFLFIGITIDQQQGGSVPI